MTIIKHVSYRNRNFVIVKKDGFFCAIEQKYIKDGKLITTLNGLQMHASRSIQKCVASVIDSIEIDFLVNDMGMSKAMAFCSVMQIPYNPEFEKMFESGE